jgi:hypothetical protein
MTAIAPISIASATASNWLKEAQEALISAANQGGLMGALQNAKHADGSIKNYLASSQNTAANLALISFSNMEEASTLTEQIAAETLQKRLTERLAAAQKLSEPQKNFTPPKALDPFIYFADGSFIDTQKDILTLSDGTQIDITTGTPYIEPGSLIQMANGAYLDTKNNILTLPDGTKIDIVTGLNITV